MKTRATNVVLPVVQFFEGPYFRRPLSDRSTSQKISIANDPLYQPLQTIGVDEAGIRRLFKQCSRGLIQRWIRITDAAMHDAPHGFPGFKSSPAAFLMDAIQNERMPPDWIYAHEKDRQRQQWESRRQEQVTDEAALREQYDAERSTALQAFLNTSEARSLLSSYEPTFREFYRAVEPDRFHQAAHAAVTGKIERENFQYPSFGVWLLERQVSVAD